MAPIRMVCSVAEDFNRVCAALLAHFSLHSEEKINVSFAALPGKRAPRPCLFAYSGQDGVTVLVRQVDASITHVLLEGELSCLQKVRGSFMESYGPWVAQFRQADGCFRHSAFQTPGSYQFALHMAAYHCHLPVSV